MDQPIYLVTGSGGFVGGEIVRRLSAQGIRVRGMVRDPGQAEAVRALQAEGMRVAGCGVLCAALRRHPEHPG